MKDLSMTLHSQGFPLYVILVCWVRCTCTAYIVYRPMLRRADFDSFDTVILLDIPLIGELEESRANLQEFSDTARRGFICEAK